MRALLLALVLTAASGAAYAQGAEPGSLEPVQEVPADVRADDLASPDPSVETELPGVTDDHGDADHGAAGAHAADGDHGDGHGDGHGPSPPIWLVIPFVVLLLMIATGPLFYAHHWHHHYPKYAVGLGVIVAAFYLFVLHSGTPILHAAEEYFAFIALLGSLYVASGTILIKTDFAGTPKANSALLLVGAVLSNFIGTTGASMLLIRPFMRLNAGRIRPYHIIFFIFIVSNVGGALTPIGDPPLFLGFLRGVPFFWTVAHIWYIWLPTILLLTAVFYVIDGRNKQESIREVAEDFGIDVHPGQIPGQPAVPEAAGIRDVEGIHDDEVEVDLGKKDGRFEIAIEGKSGFAWLAVIIAAVFIDPKVIPALKDTVLDLHHFGVPFGIREVIMGAVAFLAYRFASKEILRGNDFNFEPIKEVGFLFIGIFLTMQPALTLIGEWATSNADSIGVSTFYFGTGVLSGVLDNAPTYVSFLSAAMGKFGMDVNLVTDVTAFAAAPGDPSGFYLQAISVAAVFWGAMTYIGNGPNFMVKAIAESSGVDCPSFGGYVLRYSLPILVPIYILVWLVFFSGFVLPHPPDAAHQALMQMVP